MTTVWSSRASLSICSRLMASILLYTSASRNFSAIRQRTGRGSYTGTGRIYAFLQAMPNISATAVRLTATYRRERTDQDIYEFVGGDLTRTMSTARFVAGQDITYVFPDHYVAVGQLVCSPADGEPLPYRSFSQVHSQLARIDRMVFSSVLVNGTVLLI